MFLYKPGRAKELRPLSDSKQRPPKAKGEYRILDSNTKEVLYIGVSNNLDRRMKEHIKTGKLNQQAGIFAFKVADGRASQARINDHERNKINKHSPKLNQRAGGAGRPYKPKSRKNSA